MNAQNDFVLGGYVLTRRVQRDGFNDARIVPETFLTLSACRTGEITTSWGQRFLSSEEEARELLSKLGNAAQDVRILAFAIRREHVATLPEQATTEALRDQLPPPKATPIGFEPIGWDHGTIHTWLCGAAESNLAPKFELTLNKHGLFDNESDAAAVCNAINASIGTAQELGEPCQWTPVLLLDPGIK